MVLSPLRSRWAALLLLLASPGIAGLAVDAAHPCPEQAPWTVEAQGHHHDQPATEHHDCKCVGTCQSSLAASLRGAEILAPRIALEFARPAQFPSDPAFVSRPLDRLPPATAPPLV